MQITAPDLLEQITDAFYALDADWRFTYINRHAEQLWGRNREELLGRRIWDVFPEAVGSESYHAHQRAARERTVVRTEALSPVIHGWIAVTVYPLDEGLTVYFCDISEKKQLEEEFHVARERLSMALAAAHIAAWGWDLQTDRTFYTENAEEVFGIRDDSPPEAFQQLIVPEDLPRIREAMDQALRGEGDYHEEYRIIRPDGLLRWVASQGRLLSRGGEERIRFAGVSQDITTRKEAETTLRESESYFRTLAEALPQIVWTAGPDGVVDYYNHRMVTYCGVVREEMYVTGWRTVLHPDDRQVTLDAWEEAVRTGQPYEIEHRVRRADGEYRWHLSRGIPVRDAEGQIVRWFGTATDTHEQKRVLEELRINEERLRLAAQAANFGTYDIDLVTGAVYWSPELRELFGIPENGRVIQAPDTPPTHTHPADWERVMAAVRAARDPGGDGNFAVEHRVLRPDGTVRWVMAQGKTWFVGEGADRRAVRATGTVLDMTERKRLEEKLRQTAADLAEADRRKDEFLAMLAHELRNPLAPILNAAYVLGRRGAADPAVQRHSQVIDRQVRHMARLLDDLLDVARITRGKIALRRETLDLSAALEPVLEGIRPLIEERGHTLTVNVPAEPVRLEADPARLHQIVDNLLQNAAKYTEPGGRIFLTVAVEGEEAVLRVRDTGIGIPAEVLPRIFDLFTQADRTLARSEGGLGIGLTMVRRLVEMHGGAVTAASAGPGRGSEFTVRLPRSTAERRRPDEGEPERASEPAAAPPPVQSGEQADRTGEPKTSRTGQPFRVLAVEDNLDTAESLRELMELWGYEVRVVHTGSEGLAAAGAFQPHVILLDIGLPGMDGYAVAQELRRAWRDAEGNAAILIALTGYGQDEDRRRALAAGFHFHLTKPVDPEELRRTLATVLQR